MRQKTIEINPYCATLTMFETTNLNWIEQEYKTKSLEGYGAVTFDDESEYRHYIVAFTDKKHLSNIAHEIVHIKNYIYRDCAMELDIHNDEPEAYLTGWLFEEIYKFLNEEVSEFTPEELNRIKDTVKSKYTGIMTVNWFS